MSEPMLNAARAKVWAGTCRPPSSTTWFRSGVDGASDWEVAAEVDRTAAVRRRPEADQP